jgi:glycosyltransferase involved in cell wall biosynthesis
MLFEIGISIICSNYNSAKWIEGYLKSINSQYYSNFEIIFIDAASTDGSIDTISKFKFKHGIDSRVIVCNENISVYKAWNIGVEAAKNDWIMNLNTDDRIFASTLFTYSLYVRHHPKIDLFYSPCFVTSHSDHSVPTLYNNWPEYSHEELLKACMCGPFPLVRKKAIEEMGYFDLKYEVSGDYAMWLKMSKAGMKFFRIQEPLGSYYHNPEGVSIVRMKEAVKEDTKLRKIYA